MQIKLVDYNMGGAQTVLDALSVCRGKQCSGETLEHCLTAKPVPHLSALEFMWFCFLVSGMSIKTRLQVARHRHFSTMERSTRHINMAVTKAVSPPNVGVVGWAMLEEKAMGNYANAVYLGGHIEDAAYLLPMATPTTFYIAGNGRAWFEYLQKRLCVKYVQAEHYIFARKVFDQLVKILPGYGHARPCRDCGVCEGV